MDENEAKKYLKWKNFLKNGVYTNCTVNIILKKHVEKEKQEKDQHQKQEKEKEINIIGVSSLTHRGEPIDFGYYYEPLVKIDIDTWEEGTVPNWLSDIEITKPGSTGK